MNRVLITGANRWIGSHVIKLLIEKEYEVHAVSRRKVKNYNLKCKWHKMDILNVADSSLIQTVKPTHMLHFAWEATPRLFVLTK